MLRTRNLPWRSVLRSSPRLLLRQPAAAATSAAPAAIAASPRLLSSSSSGAVATTRTTSVLLTPAASTAAASRRCFSITPARRKAESSGQDDDDGRDNGAKEAAGEAGDEGQGADKAKDSSPAQKGPARRDRKEKGKQQQQEPAEPETDDTPSPIPRPRSQPPSSSSSSAPTSRPSVVAALAAAAGRRGRRPAAAAAAAAASPSSAGSDRGSGKALSKPSIPDIYPTVLAIPIARRPLFPGFYKAITIRDPNVIAAIEEMAKRGQPYVGAFLLKDERADKDVIDSPDEVHDVGVFAQITSTFPVNHGEQPGMTAVLYPHRRIRMTDLVREGQLDKDPAAEEATSPESPQPSQPTAATTPTPTQTPPPTPDAAAPLGQPPSPVPPSDSGSVASFDELPVTPSTDPTTPLTPPDADSPTPTDVTTFKYDPTAFLRGRNVSLVSVENLEEEPFDRKSPIIRAVTGEIINVFKDVANLNPLFRDQISTFSMSQSAGNITEEPAKLADFAAAVSAGELSELQDVLATMNVEDRLSKALVVLKKELMNAQLQSKISKDVEAKIQKRQREYWLMEQMKGIRRELGIESDGKDKLVEGFREKAGKLAMPEAVKKVFDEEVNKLAHLEPAASEFNVTRNYLDWITQIPWGVKSKETFSIKNAMTVLDEDHYGLKDVKDRILEFIAVGKLRGTVEGKILCFVGPPGVGKTSIGKSIARALNREYYRFSVGGLTDVAEIKGHRRTYVGALPGRIIQALKKCQTENPLILIDEVDKIGRGHQGDPSSALLELLDPEQNGSFLDHYMDVPVDLSKVLFVCTANMTDTIPRPLLDRMEMIELSGYVADEKMAIAERYLAPAAKEMSGLKGVDVNMDKSAVEELIKSYCRESGVRNLKKQIEKVYRKAALKIIQDIPEEELQPEEEKAEQASPTEDTAASATTEATTAATTAEQAKGSEPAEDSQPSTIGVQTEESPTEKEESSHIVPARVPDGTHLLITRDNLKDYVGPPIFTSDRLYETTPPGVVMGLAWTSMGGAALYVESILESALSPKSAPGFEQTGNLQSVMKESTVIAYSFAKSLMAREFPDNKFFEKAKVHLHCPEGAVSKDGPSAGITMATSLLSLAFNHPLAPTIAMTGELTVTGKVLRIGGLREKTVAARRAGSKMIIFPADNMSDWLELPENIREGIEGHAVSWYSEVFDIVFKDLDKEAAGKLWREQLAEHPASEPSGAATSR